ncbi:MAG: hypothetical protein V4476_11085 [Pseudomonadota bacterium]
MRLPHRYAPRLSTPALFLFALLATYLYLVLRSAGLYPTVFSDEWSYSSFTRLMPFRDTQVPSYLYYTVYRLTNFCGDGFLQCARLINAAFYVGAAPLIYLVARRYTTARMAALVAVLAILMPSNSYTTYFMPEAMYFCGFWLFSWTVLRAQGRTGVRAVMLSSALLGLLAMVKVHALFLVPGYLVYLVYLAYTQREPDGRWRWLRQAVLLVAAALLTAAAVRLAVGYLYAGRNGLYLLGTLYANQAQTRPGLDVLVRLALVSLQGHLMALALMFGVPLAAAALQCCSSRQRHGAARGSNTLLAYAALMIPSLVAVTALFTAMVAGSGSESGARLHMRYYDFALPLLLILAGAQLTAQRDTLSWRHRLAAALPLLLVVGAAGAYLIPAYTPNYIDSPTLFGMTQKALSLHVLTAVALAALLLWVANARNGMRLFVYLFLPLALLVASHRLNLYTRGAYQADAYVKAGQYAHQYLSRGDADRLTIVGGDFANLLKSRFFVDNTNVALLQVPPGKPIPLAQLAHPNGWLLVVGDYPLPDGAVRHSGLRDYTLARLGPASDGQLYRFAETEDYSMRSTGLSGYEDWGRWSDSAVVTLTFAQPLPRKLLLRLDVAAYGPNAGQAFEVAAGGQPAPLRAQTSHAVHELRLETDGQARSITIKVPQPTSPHELGLSADQRQLGIALYSIEVIDAAAPRRQ